MTTQETGDKPMNSSGGTMHGYFVEGRSTYSRPQEAGGQVFDERWQRIHFCDGPGGVPRGNISVPILAQANLHSYPAAQALRWWFHANIEPAYCIETRIVKCKITYSVETHRDSEHFVIGGEDRSSLLPDWGK